MGTLRGVDERRCREEDPTPQSRQHGDIPAPGKRGGWPHVPQKRQDLRLFKISTCHLIGSFGRTRSCCFFCEMLPYASGRTPGLCRFICSFRMWWTTAAALKACWGDTRPVSDCLHPRGPAAFPLPHGRLKPTCAPLISQKGPGSSSVCRRPQGKPPAPAAPAQPPGPRRPARLLERTTHPPLALGEVLLDLEAD